MTMYNTVWIGAKDSYQPVLEMLQAKRDGKLLDLMANSPAAMKLYERSLNMLSDDDDDDDFRIGESLLQVVGNVGIISVKGALVTDYAWYNSWFGLVSYDEIRDAVSMAVDDSNVSKILLNITSPGGSAAGIGEISDYIKQVDTKEKPVYGHTDSYAHSAGYWLLSSTRNISAGAMASTGSIGVIMTLVSYAKMYEDYGIEFTYLRSGKYKALGQAGEELSEEAKQEFMDMVTTLHGFFERQVMSSRGSLATQNKSKWNEGKTFFSKQSLELGLIDEINTFDGKIAKLYDSVNNFQMSESCIEELTMKFKLSEEQIAKLAAGVPLEKLGLSAEDLEKAKAVLASEESEESTEESDTESETTDAEDETTEDDTETPSETTAAVDVDKIIELTTRATTAETKLETASTELAAEKEKNTALLDTQKKLVELLGESAGRLQVGLGKSATDLSNASPEDVITAYTTARDQLLGTFDSGQTSESTVESRADGDAGRHNPIIKRNKKGDK